MDGKPVVIQDFQADFEATLFEFDEKTKERRPHSAHLTEFWKRTSDPMARYRRHLIEPLDQKTTVHGYDGRIFWQQLGTAAADELRGRNARTDVQKIRDEINRTTEFLRLLVLSNLEDAGVTWTMTPTTKVRTNDAERDVVGIRRTKDGERPIELLFGTTDSRLYAFIRDGDDKHPKESILFAVHEPVGVAGGRLLVPQVIQYKENDALTVEARVAKPTDLKFNVNLEEKLFQIPR